MILPQVHLRNIAISINIKGLSSTGISSRGFLHIELRFLSGIDCLLSPYRPLSLQSVSLPLYFINKEAWWRIVQSANVFTIRKGVTLTAAQAVTSLPR